MGDLRTDPNWNPRMRNQGNPHARRDTRQAQGRSDVMPSQGKSVPRPGCFGAKYRLGAPIRPNSIVFDNGFLDKFKPREPTAADYVALTKWRTKLLGAEKIRLDLKEACEAYRHFLDGNGRPRTFSYESYVMNDKSGETTLANAMRDIQEGVEIIWESNKSLEHFDLTGDQIACGSNALFPYPQTENWQKAIGGHIIWLSGSVKVIKQENSEPCFRVNMVLHAEDRYNFNPGQHDIVTRIPDSDNGIFEITGLGKQFTQTAELKRIVEWKYGTLEMGSTSTATIPLR